MNEFTSTDSGYKVPKPSGYPSWPSLFLTAVVASVLTSVATIVVVDRFLERNVFERPSVTILNPDQLDEQLLALRARYGSIHKTVQQLATNDDASMKNIGVVVNRISDLAGAMVELTAAAENSHALTNDLKLIAMGLSHDLNEIESTVQRIEGKQGVDRENLREVMSTIHNLTAPSIGTIPELVGDLNKMKEDLSALEGRLKEVEARLRPSTDTS